MLLAAGFAERHDGAGNTRNIRPCHVRSSHNRSRYRITRICSPSSGVLVLSSFDSGGSLPTHYRWYHGGLVDPETVGGFSSSCSGISSSSLPIFSGYSLLADWRCCRLFPVWASSADYSTGLSSPRLACSSLIVNSTWSGCGVCSSLGLSILIPFSSANAAR